MIPGPAGGGSGLGSCEIFGYGRRAQVAGGYLSVENKGAQPDHLVGGSLAAAQTFEIHEMSSEGGVMKMRPTGPLEIPPGGTLTLAPSGRHIMFTGLKHGLKKGQDIDGTLVFERAGTIPVRFGVQGIGAKGPSGSPDGTWHEMPGMKMD